MNLNLCVIVLVGLTGWAAGEPDSSTYKTATDVSLKNASQESTNNTPESTNTTLESTNASQESANNTLESTNNSQESANITQESTNNSQESANVTQESPNNTQEQAMSYNGTDLTNNSTECYMKMVNITLQCQNETGASDDDVNTAIHMEIPSTDAGKCLMRCLLKTRGWMTPEGLFSANVTASYLTRVHKDPELEPEFVKLGEFCYEKLKSQPIENIDTCQFAYDIAVCCDDYHKTMFPVQRPNSPPVNAITVP